MNTNRYKRSIKFGGLLFSLFFGLVLMSSATTANAQYRNDRRDDDRNSRRDDREYNRRDNDRYNDRDDDRYNNDNRNSRGDNYSYVTQQAYRDGLNRGAEDANNNRRSNAQRAAAQATGRIRNNNNPRYGSQGSYKQAYREAFIQGYEEGYNRYDNRSYNRRRNGSY